MYMYVYSAYYTIVIVVCTHSAYLVSVYMYMYIKVYSSLPQSLQSLSLILF